MTQLPIPPLAFVLVANPNPITLTQIARLATWCEVVLIEGTSTFSGQPRHPLGQEWHRLTGLDHPLLRVVTTNLGSGNPASRERHQRDCVLPLVWRETDDERIVLMLDSDELIDQAGCTAMFERLDAPGRIGLVPLYGAVDRVARSIHCCAHAKRDPLRDPTVLLKRPYALAGPLACRVKHVRQQSLHRLRLGSPVHEPGPTCGYHLTMLDSAESVSQKLDNLRHRWEPRVKWPTHLDTMLSAGVHHAGWWIADYREPEDWLMQLAHQADLRVAGPMRPMSHLRALRAWAEARLDPQLPDTAVRLLDDYACGRNPQSTDFLNDLDSGQLARPMARYGHLQETLALANSAG